VVEEGLKDSYKYVKIRIHILKSVRTHENTFRICIRM